MLKSKTCRGTATATAHISCLQCCTRYTVASVGLSPCGMHVKARTSHWRHVMRAVGEADDSDALESARDSLSRLFEIPTISGQELRELVFSKWGRSYDVRLHKRGRRHAASPACCLGADGRPFTCRCTL